MRILVTGGTGFIGRWVVKKLLDEKVDVTVLDNLSNSQLENLVEFKNNSSLKEVVVGDVGDKELLHEIWSNNEFGVCIHLAAKISVQESIDNPIEYYAANVLGTLNILEEARRHATKVVLVSTCMVYEMAQISHVIDETHPVKPASPYAASKLAGEHIAMSYYYTYRLPVVVARPFNTYGPFQKSNMEGGVISIFIQNSLDGTDLIVYGDGTQTRDFLYVEDCADFLVKLALSNLANGQIINAGLGRDISISALAMLIATDPNKIRHVPHHHPQSEIPKLVCDCSKAQELLGWKPKVSLEDGINKQKEFLKSVRRRYY